MSSGGRFVASAPWRPDRPEALVVCCSDGRWHEQVQEFLRAEVSDRPDLYAVPGGAAAFALRSASLDEVRALENAFRFLVEHHRLRSVWLVAHQDCAHYRAVHSMLAPSKIRERQLDDLSNAAEWIGRSYPDLRIRRVYVSIVDGRVAFDDIE